MRICGLQKLAMVDFPGKIAATVFTGGCNLRCPFCHNAPLVNRPEEAEKWEEEEVLAFLAQRRGLLDGMVLSGGEPLLQEGVETFLAKVREMGYAVKLDTNGCYPQLLKRILEAGLGDDVAMDIKNSLAKSPETVGCPGFDTAPVEESVRILMEGKVDYEFRTTAVSPFHTPQDIEEIGRWLSGAPRYFLQTFVDSGNLVGEGCQPFSPEEMRELAQKARPWFKTVEIRGI